MRGPKLKRTALAFSMGVQRDEIQQSHDRDGGDDGGQEYIPHRVVDLLEHAFLPCSDVRRDCSWSTKARLVEAQRPAAGGQYRSRMER